MKCTEWIKYEDAVESILIHRQPFRTNSHFYNGFLIFVLLKCFKRFRLCSNYSLRIYQRIFLGCAACQILSPLQIKLYTFCFLIATLTSMVNGQGHKRHYLATGLIIQNLHHNFLYKPRLIQQTGLPSGPFANTCCVGKSCFRDSLANTQSCYSLHMGYGIMTWITFLPATFLCAKAHQ